MTERPPPKISDSLARPLPKRFYKSAAVAPRDGHFSLELDGRQARTPLRHPLAVASRPIADAIAAEWASQVLHIDPATMPLTRLVATAIDAVTGKEAEVAAEIVAYAGSDMICYRAASPEGLVAAQARYWDPVLVWARDTLDAPFAATTGLMHVAQPSAAVAAIATAIAPLPTLRLAALNVLTTLSGSALLALALERRHLSFDALWNAAHVDEDWQIAQWGIDAEAAARRTRRHADAMAAAFVLTHA